LTLVAQGLSLPALIRVLELKGDSKAECEEHVARVAANQAALAYVEGVAKSEPENRTQLDILQAEYHERMIQLEREDDDEPEEGEAKPPTSRFHQISREALNVERETIIELRNQHRINDETLRVVLRDIDLADARLFEREL
jgi:CPA1 family monovalent cation:H+ antiporter